MKTIVRTLALLVAFAGAAACQQFHIDTQVTPEKAAAAVRMECDALTTYTVPSTNPGTITFNVSSNTPWTITRSSGADWCTVTPSSSASSSLISDVVVSFEPNEEDYDRQATLTVRGEGVNKTYVVTITQARFGRLFVTPIAQDYSAAGGPLSFTILTNEDWQITTDVSWLHFNRENGAPDPEGRTLTIIATADPSTVLERTATVTVTAGDEEESFEVTQKAKFEVSAFEDAFDSKGGSQTFQIRTELPWTVTADKTWLSFDSDSGEGNATVTATAGANDGAVRGGTITVSAGDTSYSFDVTQKGLSFEIVTPESTTIPGGYAISFIEVNADMDWTPETSNPDWTVEKVDGTQFKLTTPFNKYFAPQTGTVAIVAGANRAELELTKDINFTFEGAEVQEDGSVKIFGDRKSRVTFKDPFRYVSIVLEIGDKSFDDAGQFWMCTHDAAGDSELQCQISLNGNKRLRTNGGHTTYGSSPFDITKDEMNAITEYRVDFKPNADDATKIDLEFFYNGNSKKVHTSTSPFAGNADANGHYFFGTDSGSSGSATWYIVKSCTPTVIAE